MTFQVVDIEKIWFEPQTQPATFGIDPGTNTVVLTLLWEAIHPVAWIDRLKFLIQSVKSRNQKVVLVVNSWYKNFQSYFSQCAADDIIFLDFFLILVYLRLFERKESPLAQQWNAKNTTWLLLTGKPNKANRLNFLYFLSTQNLLDDCVWSLHCPESHQDRCISLLPDLSAAQAKQWIHQHQRNPDAVQVIETKQGLHYSGIPYGTVYSDALFQVVTETNCNVSQPWITEKTWLPIVNQLPFMIFGNPTSMQKLTDLGFDCYESLLLDHRFDRCLDVDQRYQSLAINVRYWLNALLENQSTVAQITKHNQGQFVKLAKIEIAQLQQALDQHRLNVKFDEVIQFADNIQQSQWAAWYHRIRDSSWPDCPTEQCFVNLPDHIRKECVEVFGYYPGKFNL